ncbi:hypothetical protein E4T56_gene16512 [Termitomyces sp. T112]|nr:hypothetical protein E4T56_gene16512 [Termitomyces sp. T112]
MEPTQPYNGVKRKLLIGLDIGTTCSGASYSVLEPGRVPEIKPVTRFADQEHVGGDSKVPSIVLYSREDGRCLAAGAKATKMEDSFEGNAPPWYKVEWFKLHMRPNPGLTSYITKNIPPLPPKKTIVEIFADFLRYLNTSVVDYIRETHYNSVNLVSLEYEREFVLTHPNGWEGAQQSQLREAAVMASLIPDTDDAKSRIHFVTEGEAGLHFCIRRGLTLQSLNNGEGILVIDAGGGTVDMSAYGRRILAGKSLYHEICEPQCIFKGSVFVTRNATEYLKDRLCESSFLNDVPYIASCFDRTTKLRFSSIEEPQYIKFGRPSDRNEELGILSGQIKLTGTRVASFFQPCTEAITESVLVLAEKAKKKISTVFLIGGFSASNFLYRTLKDSLSKEGLELYRPDSHLNKAVADGAISFYIDHLVRARYSKYTYGIASYIPYDITNVEHRQRLSTVFTDSDGVDNVQHVFVPILYKGTEVMEVTEFREQFFRKAEARDDFPDPMTDDILCYRGLDENPRWTDIDSEMYTTLCTVVSDVSKLKQNLRRKRGRDGRFYYCLDYDIILQFGLTELKAQTCWREHGQEKRSPAKILYGLGDQNDPNLV